MKKSLSNVLSFVIVSVALVSILPTYSLAAQGDPILNKKELKVLLATAKTPAEHRTIAAYYRQQAQALIAKSAEHSAMAEERAKGPATLKSKQVISWASHCRYFANQYAEQAKEAASLASAHEEMATKAERR